MTVPLLISGRPLAVVNEDGSAIAGGGGGPGGGLTDTELRATPVEVEVTSMPPGGSSLTDSELRATPVPVSVPGTVELAAATLAALETIQVGNFPATQPVSGTFWQATQPVSGPLTDAQLRAADVPVGLNAATLAALETISVANFPASQAVTGTFWQATQPVSGPLTDAQLRAAAVPVSGPLTDAQLRATAVPISAPVLTKGAQGANGLSTQDLKDAGRNAVTFFMALPILTTAAEVMMSLTGYKGGAAVAATATPAVVTAGKVFRISSITISYIATATAGLAKFTIRVNTGGVAVIGSPLVLAAVVGAGTPATAGSFSTVDVPLPDGWELPAGAGIAVGLQGLSAAMAGAIAGYGHCIIHGYEY